jgi:hypothetical protein
VSLSHVLLLPVSLSHVSWVHTPGRNRGLAKARQSGLVMTISPPRPKAGPGTIAFPPLVFGAASRDRQARAGVDFGRDNGWNETLGQTGNRKNGRLPRPGAISDTLE